MVSLQSVFNPKKKVTSSSQNKM